MCRTHAHLLTRIIREHHVWKMNYSTNKVLNLLKQLFTETVIFCWAATIKFSRLHKFPDLSLTLDLFPPTFSCLQPNSPTFQGFQKFQKRKTHEWTKRNLKQRELAAANLTRQPLWEASEHCASTFRVFLRSSPDFFSTSTICRAVLAGGSSVLAFFPPRPLPLPAPAALLFGGISQLKIRCSKRC